MELREHYEIMDQEYAIVVFSHLRWEFVYQRPQHLLSRMAKRHRVIYIEEPIYKKGIKLRWKQINTAPNVSVFQLYTPVPFVGFEEPLPDKRGAAGLSNESALIPSIRSSVRELIKDLKIDNYVVWLYTPMALPIARTLDPVAVVYDCMDELSAFQGASPALVKLEADLLKWADVVFTGGPSLYRAKLGKHDNLHCFPSSVDTAHFRHALQVDEATDQVALPHPRLGYYGVIDERMDLPLLAALAAAHPEWQIVMVGPLVKIEPRTLPKRSNLHYLGQRSYDELPSYLAGWDVCLMPFALNEATRFISPTKTLEYMAAELPIVSTPITDVAEPYGGIVYLGGSPEEFIAACEQALASSPSERAKRAEKMRAVLARTSWDATAQSMERLIEQAVGQKEGHSQVDGAMSGHLHTAGQNAVRA